MIAIQPMIFEDYRYNELWKPLLFEGIECGEYLISNFGNIYDLKENKYVTKHISNSNGYVYVNLRHNDKLKSGSLLLHRLVATNFIAYKREDQNQVNHKNGKKTYNHEENLEWSTPKENTNHAFKTGLAKNNIGEYSHLAKLTNLQVEQICQLLSEGYSYKDILIKMNIEVTPNTMDMIGNIYRRIAWKNISCKYTFPDKDNRFRVCSKETIELICKCIEGGMSNKEVYEYIYNKPLVISKDSKQDYERIRLIRNKKQFVDISSKYKF